MRKMLRKKLQQAATDAEKDAIRERKELSKEVEEKR